MLQYSPYHSNVPLFPVIRHLVREAGIEMHDALAVKVDKLTRRFAPDKTRQESVSLVAELLDIRQVSDAAAVGGDPAANLQLTIEALVDFCASMSSGAPLLIMFEDLQWIDPTSRLLLGRLTDWAKDANALVAVTLRANNRGEANRILRNAALLGPGNRVRGHVAIRKMRELGKEDGQRLALVAAATTGHGIPVSRLDALVDKSGGIPLFLEELVKAAASGVEFADGPDSAAEAGMVPNTIRDALMAQLDQLGFAKEVAQYAAVIGHEFSADLLARLMRRSPNDLAPALKALIDARIITAGRAQPSSYSFKHTLIRDISYRSLLKKNRRQIHGLVAQALAARPAEVGIGGDDLIAQHYSLAASSLEAITFWLRGAGMAISRSANEEAVAMLKSALAEMKRAQGKADPALELDLVLAQAMALRSLRGYSAPEVEQALTRARQLCSGHGDIGKRVSVDWGLFQCTFVAGDIERARGFASGLLALAGRDAGEALVDAHLAIGMVAFDAGEFAAAVKSHGDGARLCRPETDQPRFLTHGQNAGLFCLSYLARTQCIMGHLDQGYATIARAQAIAATRSQEPGHIHSSLNVTIQAVRLFHMCGNLEVEKRLAADTVEVARAQPIRVL